MKKILLIVGALVVTSIFLSGCTETDAESWTWELLVGGDGWNVITFTQQQISCCASDSPEDVFNSIDAFYDYVFEEETWYNYWNDINNGGGGTLQHIQPNTIYRISVSQDCTLTINKC